jgi:hypothetical protein
MTSLHSIRVKEDCPLYPAKTTDVRSLARALSDDVDTLVEGFEGARRATCGGGTRGARYETRTLLRAVQHKLATIYGERHGWRLSASDFRPAVLARRGVSARAADPADDWMRAVADHPFFYRAADRRAVAVAAHLYDARHRDRVAIQSWAAAHRLRVAFPTDFPSWWVPGGTTLCVYEPLLEVEVDRHV